MNPLISIIVPCYNQAQYLDECLLSVFEQSYNHWECIIVNDGSTDNTEETAKKWSEKDPRFSYHYKENGGLSSARNFGINKAKGDWIQFLDSDDILHQNKFEKSIPSIKPEVRLIITNFNMLTEDYTILHPFCDLTKYEFNFKNILTRWSIDFNIPIHCALINKKLLDSISFNTAFRAKEDWIFWLDVFELNNFKTHYINKQLVSYRINSTSMTKDISTFTKINKDAYSFIYHKYDETVKELLYEKILLKNYKLSIENHNQKKYIRQLQNTKVLKYYLWLKKLIFNGQ